MQVTDGSRLNLDAEPRLKRAATDETPKADHPFFWAGYMLVDCGTAAGAAGAEGRRTGRSKSEDNRPGRRRKKISNARRITFGEEMTAVGASSIPRVLHRRDSRLSPPVTVLYNE